MKQCKLRCHSSHDFRPIPFEVCTPCISSAELFITISCSSSNGGIPQQLPWVGFHARTGSMLDGLLHILAEVLALVVGRRTAPIDSQLHLAGGNIDDR